MTEKETIRENVRYELNDLGIYTDEEINKIMDLIEKEVIKRAGGFY